MERRFSIEATSFRFLSKEGFSDFRLEERRKNFVGYILRALNAPLGWWTRWKQRVK
jgi:hypothetical protein